ncbi:MAG TPA: hypothetical protein VGB73_20455 [Pyrinomonadaceae bacterium]
MMKAASFGRPAGTASMGETDSVAVEALSFIVVGCSSSVTSRTGCNILT